MRKSILVLSLLLLGSCAGLRQEPIVDIKGVNRDQYAADLAECRQYAGQVDTGGKVAGGAAAGAVLGGVVGAIVGNHDTAARSAGVGAVAGGAKGAGGAMQERRQVVRNCLINRGYHVLN